MKTAEGFVCCLEQEGIEHLCAAHGEESPQLMDALPASSILIVTPSHEQGAALTADVCGRLLAKAPFEPVDAKACPMHAAAGLRARICGESRSAAPSA